MKILNLFKKKEPITSKITTFSVVVPPYWSRFYMYKYRSTFRGMRISLTKQLKKMGVKGYKAEIRLEFILREVNPKV